MFKYTVIILLTAIVLSILALFLVKKFPKLRVVFQIGFALIIIALAIFLVKRIMQPIEFKQERMKRESATIQRLKEIRSVQEAYKDKFGKYTGSFDTLITYVKTDSFEIPKLEITGAWNQDEVTQEDAIKQGLIKKSISRVSVRDSLFNTDYQIENLRYIPFTERKEFVMGAGKLQTGSQVIVQVFEAYALYDILFAGMDRQMVINYKDERYKLVEFEGIKVGSLAEANNNAGNWEK
jgi:hypothetical protein